MMRKSNWLSNKKKVLTTKIKIFKISIFLEKDRNFDDDDNDIMSHLNYRKLEEIKKDFIKNED